MLTLDLGKEMEDPAFCSLLRWASISLDNGNTIASLIKGLLPLGEIAQSAGLVAYHPVKRGAHQEPGKKAITMTTAPTPLNLTYAFPIPLQSRHLIEPQQHEAKNEAEARG
jgi:hypothetical protein